MTTAITPSKFVTDFPEFGNESMFPLSGITFWATVAALLINPRFGSILNLAMELFIAHNLALEAFAQAATDNGGIPGLNRGVISSEAGSALNVSYDTANASYQNAGHWNLTTYGTRLRDLTMIFGAGPIQVGVTVGCCGCLYPNPNLLASLAWEMRGSNMGDCTYIDVGPGRRLCA
jgi:hypothetical protein